MDLFEGLEDLEGEAAPTLDELESLVLLHFFWLHFDWRSWERLDNFLGRRLRFIKQFFPEQPRFSSPLVTQGKIGDYPLGIVCKCGNILSKEAFGVIDSCFECYGSEAKGTPFYPKVSADAYLCFIPKQWHTWAESVAIQLETSRRSNRNSVTDLEGLKDGRTP